MKDKLTKEERLSIEMLREDGPTALSDDNVKHLLDAMDRFAPKHQMKTLWAAYLHMRANRSVKYSFKDGKTTIFMDENSVLLKTTYKNNNYVEYYQVDLNELASEEKNWFQL